jgi:hypothetical protein
MSISLSSLVSRLQSDVPARNSVPSAEQYERAVTEAVADFSRRAPVEKISSVNVVSGTAAYTLPTDFVRLVQLESLTIANGVIVNDTGIIPVSSSFSERLMVSGTTLTIYPTPTYSMERDLWYMAGYVLDNSDAYPDLDEAGAALVMMLATAKALSWQANAAALEAWQYQIGDERVSKEKLADALRAQAQDFERRYYQAVQEQRVKPTGSRYRAPDGSYS